ncbi:hypothetical protein J7E96_36620 [Streptomyces sp. ISL-96]|uniref:hypothetical protein n=1 Tax=Streptomyces sp. ISL-96 TaxID=2819191 RepID=UPI001BE6B144|nr:hypothetical protein [Streptomyces sp. ISL-96]
MLCPCGPCWSNSRRPQLSRPATENALAIAHDYRELKHAFEGRTWRGGHHHVTLVTAAQSFLTLRRLAPKVHTPACPSTRSWTPLGPAQVLDRHLHHLLPPTHHKQNQTQNLTKHY